MSAVAAIVPNSSRFPVGLGSPNGQAVLAYAPHIATGTLTAASAAGASWATAAIPIVGPIVVGVSLGLSALFARKRPQQKTATTKIAEQVEPLLEENLRGYFEGPRTATSQAQALANFDAGWQWLEENCCPGGRDAHCGAMGPPGEWCIDDRKRGGQFHWFETYRDPIAEDTPIADRALELFTATDAGVLGGLSTGLVVACVLIAAAALL